MTKIHGQFDDEGVELLNQSIQGLPTPRVEPDGTKDKRSAAVRQGQALKEVLRMFLDRRSNRRESDLFAPQGYSALRPAGHSMKNGASGLRATARQRLPAPPPSRDFPRHRSAWTTRATAMTEAGWTPGSHLSGAGAGQRRRGLCVRPE